MAIKEKTTPLSVRFFESDVAKIASVAPDGDVRTFIREVVAKHMEELKTPISSNVGTFGGKQDGAGRPEGSRKRRRTA